MFENMQESGLTEIIHLHRSNPGPVSCVFHILRSLELTLGSGCNLMGMRLQVFFSFLSSFRAQEFTVENGTDDDCEILVYWQKILHFLGLPSACNAGDQVSIPGSGRPPGVGNGNPLRYAYLAKSTGQRSLAGCSPWGHKGIGHDLVTKQPPQNSEG